MASLFTMGSYPSENDFMLKQAVLQQPVSHSPASRPTGVLPGLSFRQLLLAAFLLIAALLSGTSVHALFTLERMSAHSRERAGRAIDRAGAASGGAHCRHGTQRTAISGA